MHDMRHIHFVLLSVLILSLFVIVLTLLKICVYQRHIHLANFFFFTSIKLHAMFSST